MDNMCTQEKGCVATATFEDSRDYDLQVCGTFFSERVQEKCSTL